MTKLDQPPMHSELGSVGWMRQFRYFSKLYAMIDGVEGDIVECGVGMGRTFQMLCYLAGSEAAGRHVRGFDSFAGFPAPRSEDASWRNPQEGEWSHSKQMTLDLLGYTGIFESFPDLQYSLTKGFFGDTLPKEGDYPVAFLHVDADLYESCGDAMLHMFPRVSKGGIVAFDDYRDVGRGVEKGEKWPGATKAVDEALKDTGLTPLVYDEMSADYRFTKYYVQV